MNQNNGIKVFSYLRISKILLSQWYWILLSLCIGLLVSFIYLCLAKPTFSCYASLKFEDRRTELSELTSIRNIYDRTNKMESEAQIVKSRNVILRTIRSLNLQVNYFIDSGFRLLNVYPQKLLHITIKRRKSNSSGTIFRFELADRNSFSLSFINNVGDEITLFRRYGEQIIHEDAVFVIHSAGLQKNAELKMPIYFSFNNELEMVKKISRSLKTDEQQNINILKLRMSDHNPVFAADVLNAITRQYIEFDRLQRSTSATQTERFIDQLVDTISQTENKAATSLQLIKERRSIGSTVNEHQLTEKLSAIQTEKRLLSIRLMEILFLKKRIEANSSDLFNYNLQAVTDLQLIHLLNKYNELFLKKQESAKAFPRESVFMLQIDEQIKHIRETIAENINAQHQLLLKKDELLTEELKKLDGQLSSLPGLERRYATLAFDVDAQQKVLKYLTEKKLEAQVSKSAITPGAIIIDEATTSTEPVHPIPANVYTLSVLMSLSGSAAMILFIKKLRCKIHTRQEVEDLTDIAVVGAIVKHRSDKCSLIPTITEPSSALSESVRALRNNLSFIASGTPNKIIHITSEISGEGKSFIAMNLASSFTLLHKKVILIAADLRRSTMHHEFKLNNTCGLSNYLATEITLDDMIMNTGIANLHFISSGIVPPNPSELFYTNKMSLLLVELKKRYDYIVIDSAPVGIVSDCKPLMQKADINLFVLRAGLSKHQYALTPQQLKTECGFQHISIVLNDHKVNNFYQSYYNNRYL